MKKNIVLLFLPILVLTSCKIQHVQRAQFGIDSSLLKENYKIYNELNGEETDDQISLFGTSITAALYLQKKVNLSYVDLTDEEVSKIKESFNNTFTDYHVIFDRHYYYVNRQTDALINNVKVLNDSIGSGKFIKVDPLLYKALKDGYNFTINSENKFSIFIGNLADVYDEYIDLFLKYNVHVGFSLDGTREINDSQRIDYLGNGTYDTIMEKVSLCRSRGLSIGCIIVGSKKHIGHIPELYKFLCDNLLNFKFNPIFTSGEACKNIDEIGITPDDYAQMTIELFDLWYNDRIHHIKESNLEEITSNLITNNSSACMFGENCQDNFFAVAPTGDVMPCGRFCDIDMKQFTYGNLHKEPLLDVILRIRHSEIYKRSEYIEMSNCKQCKFYDICHGGCLHDGFLKSDDFKSKTFLCSAYKKIFTNIENQLKLV